MIDDFDGIAAAISLGISDEISWDLAMAKRNIPGYQFDHTVEAPDAVASEPLLRFHRIGIAGDGSRLPGMKSITAILDDEMATHQGDLILKMDIDGWEWEVFESMPEATLCHFRQICMEIHQPLGRPTDFRKRKRNLAVLRKLHYFFAPVHLHANNAAKVRSLCGLRVPTNCWRSPGCGAMEGALPIPRIRSPVSSTCQTLPGCLRFPLAHIFGSSFTHGNQD